MADFGSFMPKTGQSYNMPSGGGPWSSPQSQSPSQSQGQGYGGGYGGPPRNWGFPATGGNRGGPQWGGYGGYGQSPQGSQGPAPNAGTQGGGSPNGGMNPLTQMLFDKIHAALPGVYGQGPASAQNPLTQPSPVAAAPFVSGTAISRPPMSIASVPPGSSAGNVPMPGGMVPAGGPAGWGSMNPLMRGGMVSGTAVPMPANWSLPPTANSFQPQSAS